jgi:CRP-like cAMP-binding protein
MAAAPEMWTNQFLDGSTRRTKPTKNPTHDNMKNPATSDPVIFVLPGEVFCREGDFGDEAFLIPAGDVSIFRHDGTADRLINVERVGACIGELSLLDPAPRASTGSRLSP